MKNEEQKVLCPNCDEQSLAVVYSAYATVSRGIDKVRGDTVSESFMIEHSIESVLDPIGIECYSCGNTWDGEQFNEVILNQQEE